MTTNNKTAEELDTVENPTVGKRYHLAWANRACRWMLESIDGENCVMLAEKKGKRLKAKTSDLRLLRNN